MVRVPRLPRQHPRRVRMTDIHPQRSRPEPPAGFTINLQTLGIVFAMAAPLVGVVSSYVLLTARVETLAQEHARQEVNLKQEVARLQAAIDNAMAEHRNLRQDLDYLCFTRRRDEREANRPDDPRAC